MLSDKVAEGDSLDEALAHAQSRDRDVRTKVMSLQLAHHCRERRKQLNIIRTFA
jgi:hypothetical protein